ncbi:RagB/SusD family nutrient uptake outer membrane protein [Pedobacter sp. BS3]|uniref:RagB/SusD family nutrient uptake outer membrane protein n=1 Tax=Pedobacter sp. BS3 TaxID=2567937 RepID=UPI0011EBF995|nr:RagB/SusD family nutrient uptake outer membrane protein [Pedobacter sp. BS3]TZF83578.1 RagB/SusD family nutrient uptake outer membrane protein [Pedobacter sp. BS3]
MKKIIQIQVIVLLLAGISSCKKVIDVSPVSNEVASNYYRNYTEVNVALTGCYNGLQEPLTTEWMMTELRSDISKQRATSSTSNPNIELNQLNLYMVSPQHQQVYNYWLSSYKNIRNINYVLRSLGITYQNGQLVYGQPTAVVTDAQKAELAGQALFLRAYHYFNLVRLFGGVFLVTEPLDPKAAKQVNRSSVDECYQLIMADLLAAAEMLPKNTYSQIPSADLGRANAWAAEALLAKVYLTLPTPRKTDALTLLNDIIDNSGYGLESSYDRVFSITNEMNKEILFAVRYKAGLVGLGNPMANLFAPASSGDAIVNGDGSGYNYPTTDLYAAYISSTSSFSDARKPVNIGVFTSSTPYYVNKFISKVVIKNDAENDFPVIRFPDVLLMKAEATGFDGSSGTSVSIINQIRQRAGAGNYTTGSFTAAFYKYPASGANAITTSDAFLTALLTERRLEFAFENQRLFDLERNGQAVTAIRNYYASEYKSHYSKYKPVIALETLQANVTQEHLLLPIPQREIDTNNEITIQQNPGY